jgi:uncharacterized protein (DUF2147 family)
MKVMSVTLPDMVPAYSCADASAEEISMRALLAIATLLLACSAARAQYSIEYNGQTIRIDPDRGTVSIPGVYDNTGRKTKRARTNPDGSPKHAPAPHDSAAAPSQAATPSAQGQQAPAAVNAVPPAPNATANNAPADGAALPQLPAPAQQTLAPASPAAAPVARPQAALPTTTTVPAPAPLPVQVPAARPQPPAGTVAAVAPAAPVPDPNSPVGIWLTEEKEGKIRIEPCGNNLCGYSVDEKSNANGEQVLINMKPDKDQKWSGRIHDPNTGSNYDSTIALKGKDELRVQGCAFGGMFCGGQTWSRVN